MTILIPNLAIAGFRSFGSNPQYFERFAKVNIFIGQNNSGKSNILRFIDEIYTKANKRDPIQLEPLSRHLPTRPLLLVGRGEAVDSSNSNRRTLPLDHYLIAGITDEGQRRIAANLIARLFFEKSKIDETSICWSFINLDERKSVTDSWTNAIKTFSDQEIYTLWRILTNRSGGDRKHSWESETISRLLPMISNVNVQVIPAIRQIGQKGSTSEAFDGAGIIDRLAKLQNPDVHNQESRERFAAITKFLCEVTDRPDAKIEIPYERDTILVHMDDKVLPIESLGSGIHEVLILAAAATVLSNHVVCIEEPELHLNPILQRKLIRYLEAETSNQYFITTHSAALMDTHGAEAYHVRLSNGSSTINRVTSDNQRSNVCADLGYHPSDLLQANCIIWVEGPSDRIYLNWWIQSVDASLSEGIHYSVMFYGGRLAAHLTNTPEDYEVNDFISLRRLNRRSVMLIDSDREKPQQQINSTKRRLQAEFESGPGHAWVTDGREIENYIPQSQLSDALSKVCPNASALTTFGKYDQCLKVRLPRGKEGQAPKVEIAHYITGHFAPELAQLDLRTRLHKLRKFIDESNPKVTRTR